MSDSCHENAMCINIVASFMCTCNVGFTGDGITCTGRRICITFCLSHLFIFFFLLHNKLILRSREKMLYLFVCVTNTYDREYI